jgi:hypothetical protein
VDELATGLIHLHQHDALLKRNGAIRWTAGSLSVLSSAAVLTAGCATPTSSERVLASDEKSPPTGSLSIATFPGTIAGGVGETTTARSDVTDAVSMSTEGTANQPVREKEIAEWSLAPGESLTGASVSFVAKVTRLTCNSGATGKVFPPTVTYGDNDISVTFYVESTHTFDCPGNRPVFYTVALKESIGDRRLFDGSCRAGMRKGLNYLGGLETCTEQRLNGIEVR